MRGRAPKEKRPASRGAGDIRGRQAAHHQIEAEVPISLDKKPARQPIPRGVQERQEVAGKLSNSLTLF